MRRAVRRFIPHPVPTLDGAQVAQMLNFRGGPQDVPAPVTINQNPITCRHAAFQKPPQPRSEHKVRTRRNLSTAVLRPTASGRSLTSSPTQRKSVLQYRLHQLSHGYGPAGRSVRQRLHRRRRRQGGAAERRLERQEFRLVQVVPQHGPRRTHRDAAHGDRDRGGRRVHQQGVAWQIARSFHSSWTVGEGRHERCIEVGTVLAVPGRPLPEASSLPDCTAARDHRRSDGDDLGTVFCARQIRQATLKIEKGAKKVAQLLPARLPPPTRIEAAYWLPQNWSGRDRYWFHHTPQGTATFPIPFVWFLALERPEISLFRHPGYIRDEAFLRRLGFIPSPDVNTLRSGAPQYGYRDGKAVDPGPATERDRTTDYPDNAFRLPVGFAKAKAAIDPASGEAYPELLGLPARRATPAISNTGTSAFASTAARRWSISESLRGPLDCPSPTRSSFRPALAASPTRSRGSANKRSIERTLSRNSRTRWRKSGTRRAWRTSPRPAGRAPRRRGFWQAGRAQSHRQSGVLCEHVAAQGNQEGRQQGSPKGHARSSPGRQFCAPG